MPISWAVSIILHQLERAHACKVDLVTALGTMRSDDCTAEDRRTITVTGVGNMLAALKSLINEIEKQYPDVLDEANEIVRRFLA